MRPEIIVAEAGALARTLVDRVRVAMKVVPDGSRFALGLPGGSTAEVLLPALAQASLDWSRSDFFWGDERAVGPDDPDSNYGLGHRLFLGPIAAAEKQVYRAKAEGSDLEGAAKQYEAELLAVRGDPPVLDFVLMGMGPDGHVCSLFPGHPALGEKTRWVLAVSDSPKPPPRRVTLSLPALEAAKVVCVAAFGESKAEALRAGLEDPSSMLPVAHLARRARPTLFLLDPKAAARLSGR